MGAIITHLFDNSNLRHRRLITRHKTILNFDCPGRLSLNRLNKDTSSSDVLQKARTIVNQRKGIKGTLG